MIAADNYIVAFAIVTLIQLVYRYIFRFKEPKQIASIHNNTSVSIVICAKNESENLKLFLPSILTQKYEGNYEVIVVDDASDDDTASVLDNLQQQFGHLHIVTIYKNDQRALPGKKWALQKGITAAKYNYILLTDADCRPNSEYWIQYMMDTLYNNKQIVLGYGAYENKPTFLNKIIRWETVHALMQYSSLASIGLPYMGVGRNLLYQKSLLKDLEKDKKFSSIYAQTPSGDDDLVISKIANSENVSVCLHPEANTISLPQTTWKSWWIQKSRHLSTGKFYSSKVKFVLGLYALTHALFWLMFIVGIIVLPYSSLFIGFSFVRIAHYWQNAYVWYKRIGEKKLIFFYPFFDFLWCIYNIIFSPFIFWKNKLQWK